MNVTVRVEADRPEIADMTITELFNEIASTSDLVVKHKEESSPNRRSRTGALEFIVALASSTAVVKLVEVLLAYVNRRAVKLELKKSNGTTLTIAAHGEGTQSVQELVAILIHSESPLGGAEMPPVSKRQLKPGTSEADDPAPHSAA